MEVHSDHVFRHEQPSKGTDADRQRKLQVSDHGIVVIELKRMLPA